MNGPRFTAPSLSWWSPIQVLTEVDEPFFNERATELALVATANSHYSQFKRFHYISIIAKRNPLKRPTWPKYSKFVLLNIKQEILLDVQRVARYFSRYAIV